MGVSKSVGFDETRDAFREYALSSVANMQVNSKGAQMFSPLSFQPDSDQDKRQPNNDSFLKNLVKDFFNKPIPLPIVLWNIIVIVIYIQVIIFLAQWGLAAILAAVFFLTNLQDPPIFPIQHLAV